MTIHDSTATATPAAPPLTPAQMRAYPLGTLVLRAGLLPLEVIDHALAEAVATGRRLGEVLIEYGLSERELARLLAAQHGHEFVDLTTFPIEPDIARLLPHSVAEMYCALPIAREGDCTVVAVPDADNAVHLTRLRDALHGAIRLISAARSDIKDAIERVYAEPVVATQREPVAPPPAAYRVEVTVESGATFLVAETPDVEAAKAIGMRLIEEAEAGGTIAVGDATVDGRHVVAVDVLRRNPA
jgi:Type II secretion system (T2SS), protein E, N-terminal domain